MSKIASLGYVIHRRPYRETSVLVDFFTRQYGRISAVAKGARGGGKSDRKSLLQPLQLLSFELNGRSQLKNLGLLEAVQNPNKLSGTCLYSALYINELLMRAVPETEPMSILFEQYQSTLRALETLTSVTLQTAKQSSNIDENTSLHADVEPILRDFELLLLQELGFLPDFQHAADSGHTIAPEMFYQFVPDQGFITCLPQQSYALKGHDILAIAEKNYSPSARRAAKFICRQAFLPIIGDKPLHSRELFIAR